MLLAGQRATTQSLADASPRTLVYTALTAATGTSSSATDAAAITTPSTLFRDGRAFCIHYTGRWINTSPTTEIQLVVRKTSAATSPMLLDSGRMGGDGANSGTWGFNLQSIVVNTSGADISAVLVGCYNRVTGTGTVQVAGSLTTPSYLWVQDLGPAADYPSAASMT